MISVLCVVLDNYSWFNIFMLHRSVAETGKETERETCEGEEGAKEEESRKAEEREK